MEFQEFCFIVRMVSWLHGFSITSWGRTAKRNQAVGGVERSWHLKFMAVDGVLDDEKREKAFIQDCVTMGLEVFNEGDHLHLEPKGQRWV